MDHECVLDLMPDHVHRVVMVTSNDLPFDTTTAPRLTVTGAGGPIAFRPAVQVGTARCCCGRRGR